MGPVPSLRVRFWGVRGSIPAPEADKQKIGGNTPCLEIRCGDEPPVIIDAGTGLRVFGQSLPDAAFEGTLLLSHFHWDHLQGFPFFAPVYSAKSKLRVVSGVTPRRLQANLVQQMADPFFPVNFDAIEAEIEFLQLQPGGMTAGSLRIHPVALHHPGGATGFRIDSPCGSLIYVSDHEHGVEAIDDKIAQIAKGADLLIYDSHFTPEEYPAYAGWGHSTWQQATRLAGLAQVGGLALFHHSPSRTDEQVERIERLAQREFASTRAAIEHETLVLPVPADY